MLNKNKIFSNDLIAALLNCGTIIVVIFMAGIEEIING